MAGPGGTRTDGAASLWLRRYGRASAPTVRLVCLPHAGGSASYFFPLAKALPAHVEVLAVQYPGRQDRFDEPCIDDLETLAERVLDVLGPRHDLPLVLFGHSMGATVGFEIARRMVDEPPAALVVSSRRAPSRHRSNGIHLLDDAGIIAELGRLDADLAAALEDEELASIVLPPIRNDYKAAETYRYAPGPPLPVPIVGICGDSDPRIAPSDVDEWRAHTAAGYTAHVLPGGHFYFGTQPAALAAILAGLVQSAGH